LAVLLGAVAPDGYSGAIRLLIAIGADGRVLGVRVLEHRETPGLGDSSKHALGLESTICGPVSC